MKRLYVIIATLFLLLLCGEEEMSSTNRGDMLYALANQSVINLRSGPGHVNELTTQAIMGTPLKIEEKEGTWVRVTTPEGYSGWATLNSIRPMSRRELDDFIQSKRVIVTTHFTLLRERPSEHSAIVADAVWGAVLQYDGDKNRYFKIILPNGERAYLYKKHGCDFEKWVRSRKPTAENIVLTSKEFLGIPYLWGGASVKGFDCSGFTKMVYFLNGIIIERDASQQALTGDEIDIKNGLELIQPGDLLFFGSKATGETDEKVTHVGIYLAAGEFIHSSDRVKINSLIPDTYNYYENANKLLKVKRILTRIDKDKSIISVKKHPWYY